MTEVEAFLTPNDEAEIVEAIRLAELNTSGEIRVHLEPHCKKDSFVRAKEIFNKLEMFKTNNRNGVLIYVAVEDHSIVIMGDQGINEKVPDNFWESTINTIIEHFKNGNSKQGLVGGILKAGEQLKKYFPYQKDDINELPNTISKGTND
ncbi:MAG: hypothetical protein COB12_04675 [Flavobacterium sp.]|nr:MAG: hypothetical protein COB12_04675 [Flavobacterium sp.]